MNQAEVDAKAPYSVGNALYAPPTPIDQYNTGAYPPAYEQVNGYPWPWQQRVNFPVPGPIGHIWNALLKRNKPYAVADAAMHPGLTGSIYDSPRIPVATFQSQRLYQRPPIPARSVIDDNGF